MSVFLATTRLRVRPGTVAQRTFATTKVPVDLQLATVTLTIRRPTTALLALWDSATTLGITLTLTVDGVAHRATGRATGGIRLSFGSEVPFYVLAWAPTYGFFGARSGFPKRLGETRNVSYEASIAIEHLAGNPVDTDVSVEVTVAPAPPIPFRSTVAFDAATDAQEISGDGVLSLTHTATGSDLAAFAATGNHVSGGRTSTSFTYAGTGMVEMWDVTSGNFNNAGYRLAGIASGAQTATSTLSGAPAQHAIGVLSMTGVDQTTPVGTSVTDTQVQPGPLEATVTVGSVGVDDLVVECAFIDTTGGDPTIGADQTQRWTENMVTELKFRGSTQPGTAGGVMSWTWGGNNLGSILGGVAFKPAAGAGGATHPSWNWGGGGW